MKLLVTGAGGFVGARLVSAARAAGHEVTAVRRHADTAAADGLDGVASCDLSDRDTTHSLFRQVAPEAVLHAAARIPTRAGEDAFCFFDDNVRATTNVLHAAKEAGVARIVLSSTMSVYGDPQYLPVDEAHPKAPTSAYGLSKLEGELYGRLYASATLTVTALRYSGVFGTGQRGGAIPTFIARCLRNEPLSLHAKGRPTSDYVWVDDVAKANLLALERKSPAPFVAYNIGGGAETSVLSLAEAIRRLCNSSSEIRLEDAASARDFRFAYDITEAKAGLAYAPTPQEDALRAFVRVLAAA